MAIKERPLREEATGSAPETSTGPGAAVMHLGWRRDLSGIYTLWLRDLIRFKRDRTRIVAAVVPPLLFLFILGTGIGSTFGRLTYTSFVYPGIIAMVVLFTSIFSAVSVVWDREFGFLKEVLVAPVSRWAVAVGRAVGGATIAGAQATILLVLAPFVDISLSWAQIAAAIPFLMLFAWAMTSLGLVVGSRMQTMESFQMVLNFLTMPMFFFSGALFDRSKFPTWMSAFANVNPFDYGVDVLRYILTGVNFRPVAVSVAVVAVFGAVAMGLAAYFFERYEGA